MKRGPQANNRKSTSEILTILKPTPSRLDSIRNAPPDLTELPRVLIYDGVKVFISQLIFRPVIVGDYLSPDIHRAFNLCVSLYHISHLVQQVALHERGPSCLGLIPVNFAIDLETLVQKETRKGGQKLRSTFNRLPPTYLASCCLSSEWVASCSASR